MTSDGAVLFSNMVGQPQVNRVEQQRNPLGPFHPAGEGARALLTR